MNLLISKSGSPTLIAFVVGLFQPLAWPIDQRPTAAYNWRRRMRVSRRIMLGSARERHYTPTTKRDATPRVYKSIPLSGVRFPLIPNISFQQATGSEVRIMASRTVFDVWVTMCGGAEFVREIAFGLNL